MRKFFSPLKAQGQYLRFLFLTGISKFSQMSIFSELNNLQNISMSDDYSTICGITEPELRSQMQPDIERIAQANNAITVVGQDTVGIIARVCTYLSQHNVNVLDISQTIIDGYFNMMMIVDYANADKDFGAMVGNLEDLGDDIGVRIRCQREEIFTKMHRI